MVIQSQESLKGSPWQLKIQNKVKLVIQSYKPCALMRAMHTRIEATSRKIPFEPNVTHQYPKMFVGMLPAGFGITALIFPLEHYKGDWSVIGCYMY